MTKQVNELLRNYSSLHLTQMLLEPGPKSVPPGMLETY